MEVYRALVVHHSASTRTRFRTLLAEETGVDLVGELADTVHATLLIRECRPQLIFLEASLHDGHVVPMLQQTSGRFPPLIVFVSTQDEDAVRAFEADALDYLREPFTDDRFKEALERARTRLQEHQIIAYSDRLLHLLQDLRKMDRSESGDLGATPYVERLVVKTGNRLVFLDADDVDWIESEGVYLRLHVGQKAYVLRESLQNVEASLDPSHFIRIHRSTMVNVRRIKEIIPHAHGGAIVVLRDGSRLKLSRTYRRRIHTTLG